MKSIAWVLCVSLGCLFSAGCSNSTGTGGGKQSEAERKVAEEATRAQRFRDLLDNGKKALEAKRFDEAVKDFAEAVRLQDDLQVRELLQQAQEARDEVRKAAYDKAMIQGGQARKEEKYSAAVAAFRDALTQLPNDKEAVVALQEAEFHDFLEKGRLALKDEQYADAVKALREAGKRQPEDKDSRDLLKTAQVQRRMQVMEQGQVALNAKQYPEAVRLFTEANDLLSDAEVMALLGEVNFQAKLQLGRQRVVANQFAAAIPDLKEAARLRPDDAETLDLLQKAKDGKQRHDKSEYDRILSSGRSSLSSRRYDDAIREFQKAKRLMPEQTEAGRLLSEAEGKKRDYENHLRSGKSAMSSRRYDDAIREFREAERLGPFGGSEAASLMREAEAKKRQEAMKKR